MPEKKIGHIQNTESQSYTGTQELRDSEIGLVGYSTEIVRKFFNKMNLEKRINQEKGTILEFGAGTGFLAEIFRSRFEIEPECVELDPDLVSLIKSKKFKCFQFLKETPQNYSAIYTSNVLEHIEDDSAILKELFDALAKGGVIGIYVPAHPFLYSTMDKEIGHVRRYTRSELRNKVQAAGFSIESLTYDEFVGFFASIFVKIVGYKNGANLGSKNSLLVYDKVVYPISRALDFLGVRYILGKNLILVAIKPE
jgi:SAM-dependent methyltransferase